MTEAAETHYPYVHVQVSRDESELASEALWEFGAAGVEERDASTMTSAGSSADLELVAYFEDAGEAKHVAQAIGAKWPARVEFVVGESWRDGWREFFKPVSLGKRLWVRPSWEVLEVEDDAVVVIVDPEHAFGSGMHESTQLVLAELDARIQGGEHLLDVGCGSGILSVAALLLGAEHADAIDIEADAIEVSEKNARVNGVEDRLSVSTQAVDVLTATYPLVLANIQAHVLIPLADAISARVAGGGTLILSGILNTRADEVRDAYPAFECVARPSRGEWVALVLERRS